MELEGVGRVESGWGEDGWCDRDGCRVDRYGHEKVPGVYKYIS